MFKVDVGIMSHLSMFPTFSKEKKWNLAKTMI